jgi:hypothetical protein
MGQDLVWEMDAEGGVEQMGDYAGTAASQNTDHIHKDRGLPH